MKKAIILVLAVLSLAGVLLAINTDNRSVSVNGVLLEKIEVYKHDPDLPLGIIDISLLKENNLIKVFTKSKELQLFKQALYEDSEIKVAPRNTEVDYMFNTDYDIIIYKSEGRPIKYVLDLHKGAGRGLYTTGSKWFSLSEAATKALYRLISR